MNEKKPHKNMKKKHQEALLNGSQEKCKMSSADILLQQEKTFFQ